MPPAQTHVLSRKTGASRGVRRRSRRQVASRLHGSDLGCQESDSEQSANSQPQREEPSENGQIEAAHDETCEEGQNLGPGCVWGMATHAGTPREEVEQSAQVVDASVVRSIQDDNFKFLRCMIMQGWEPTPAQAYSFRITLRPNGQDDSQNAEWVVTSATALHYAIACGKFQSAAVILIAFPEHAHLKCVIDTGSRQVRWTTIDLASFFFRYFQTCSPARSQEYAQALDILSMSLNLRIIPFYAFGSAPEKMAAMGDDAEATIRLLSDAASASEL